MTIKILIADDEPAVCEVVKLYLEQQGFIVYTAEDGDAALAIETKERPDLLILDVMLPKISGWELCQTITRSVPIIFLTAKSAEVDKMTGFSLGADDYITKPFSPHELVARIKAVLRRSGLLQQNGTALSFPELSINVEAQGVECNGQSTSLSPNEFELLLFLARHPNMAFSREQLLTNIWGYDFDGDDRTVDATIKRLRNKLNHANHAYIHTVWGRGYKFEVTPK
ncbi:MAG: response regulator transcription factor [Sporomusaceae bacterium]|nr:response regulator transcription factor [Sporomusaceae bacterium]